MATQSLASIADSAAALFSEISAKGINVADPKEITAAAKRMLSLLDQVQPHINDAQSAFGGQESVITQANDLRNKLNTVIATYGGK